jgi:hypothetical protein
MTSSISDLFRSTAPKGLGKHFIIRFKDQETKEQRLADID